jgi:hypothetical protein
MRGGQFETDLDRGRTERVVGVVGLQMRDRQRHAAEMQREGGGACKNPEPPRWFLFVEVRHRY